MWPIYLAGAVVAALFLPGCFTKSENHDSELSGDKSKIPPNNHIKETGSASSDEFLPPSNSNNLIGPFECPMTPLWCDLNSPWRVNPIEVNIPQRLAKSEARSISPTTPTPLNIFGGCAAPSQGVGMPTPSAPTPSVEPSKTTPLQPPPPIGRLMFQPPINSGKWVEGDEFYVGYKEENPKMVYRFKKDSARPVRLYPLIRNEKGEYPTGTYHVTLQRAGHFYRLASVTLMKLGMAEFSIPDDFEVDMGIPSESDEEIIHKISKIKLPSPYPIDIIIKGVRLGYYEKAFNVLHGFIKFFPNEITKEFIEKWADIAFKDPEYFAPESSVPYRHVAIGGLYAIGYEVADQEIRKAARDALKKLSTSNNLNLAINAERLLKILQNKELLDRAPP